MWWAWEQAQTIVFERQARYWIECVNVVQTAVKFGSEMCHPLIGGRITNAKLLSQRYPRN